jgi:hypothetical protein
MTDTQGNREVPQTGDKSLCHDALSPAAGSAVTALEKVSSRPMTQIISAEGSLMMAARVAESRVPGPQGPVQRPPCPGAYS